MDVIEFKPSQLSVTLIKIYDNDVKIIKQTLESKLAKAGKFLRGAPVLLVPTNCSLAPTNLARVIELLRHYEMVPIAIQTTDAALIEYADYSGLAVISKPLAEHTPQVTSAPTPQPSVAPLTAKQNDVTDEETLHTAKQITHTMRSGQTAQYLFNDVVVRGSVNSGAEIYAGGHLTIYGGVRGRVHAGATGNQNARILAYNFNPELVSIAGVFLLSDDIPNLAKKGWVEVSLENRRLKFNNL